MLRRARKYVDNPSDAEDIVSDSWVSLIHHAEQLRRMDSPAQSTYIMRCVSNKSIDFLRNRRRNDEWLYDDREYPTLCQHSTELASLEETEFQWADVAGFLYLLSPREREVLNLRLQEWRTDEIAAKLHISKSSVRGYAARAIHRLRSYLCSVEKGEN